MGRIDYASAVRPLFRKMSESGDLALVYGDEQSCLLVLVDVLGHGANARIVALKAESCIDASHNEDPSAILTNLHACLAGTRGAVAAVCRFSAAAGMLRYAGVGNIALRMVGKQIASLVTTDGVLGYGTVRIVAKEQKLLAGTTLIMHSDGISTHFDILECPGILYKSAGEIAGELLSRFGVKDDDASCIVMKYLQ